MLQKTVDQQLYDFYHHFSGKLLADYIYGNPRVERAICHTLNWIPRNSKRILDVGCGIGWSTREIKRSYPESFVLGIDISARMVGIARKLFEEPGLSFMIHNISEWSDIFDAPFDAIVMLDVYEHIPRELRGRSHFVLAKALSKNGAIILTYPSILHQTSLRNSQPGRLQPVDEDITSEDLSKLACDIGAHTVDCNPITIWETNDYVHAVMLRNPGDISDGNTGKVRKNSHPFESRKKRMKRVNCCMKEQVTQDGTILSNKEGPRVCVVSPNKGAHSETFIRAHVENLPAKVNLLHGGWFPTLIHDDKPLCSMPVKGLDLAISKLLNVHFDRFRNGALRKYLRRRGIQAVLAEYGPTGVNVMRACNAEGIPLIVHFHGFDAYDQSILKEYQSPYERMFRTAEAVIAVSREMESQLLALGADRERVFYNPYGVDTSLFSGADPGSSPPVFLFVGRFVDKKAPHLTILAFKKVLREFSDARLIMIGDGPLREACKQIARGLRISETIEFQGSRSHTQVAAVMRQVRALVQHSMSTTYGDSEGTPVAILEAGATGIPVVATRHAGIKDVVVEKETGFLVNEGDIERMADYMLLLAKEPALASSMGKDARQRICTWFSMERSIHNLSKIIEISIQSHKN